ncbi:MAG: alpha/beta hydrolase [Alphaproteobacteria bacterium]
MSSPASERYLIPCPGGRQVHLHKLGAGPVVVLLHESPRSSWALLPLAAKLAERFTVLALDTPGFGLSDPLAEPRPDMSHYADGLAELFDAIGLERACLYGTHTGACIAMAFAERYPQRTTLAVLDGYPVFTEAEQEEHLDAYLAPFRPDRMGTHVHWLWTRVRDQFSFFPWNRPGRAARLQRDPPPLAFMQGVVDDLLLAGDGYRVGYAAAFRYDGATPVARATAKLAITARTDDLLHPHLDRLPPLPEGCEKRSLPADREAWAVAIGDLMAPHAVDATLTLSIGGDRRWLLYLGDDMITVRSFGPAHGKPLLVWHPLPGGGSQTWNLGRLLTGDRYVHVIDLPGCGGSSPAEASPDLLRALVGAFDKPELVACGLSGGFAASVADLTDRVTLVDPPLGADLGPLPDLAPAWDGTHLTATWWMLRDDLLFKPWHRRDHAHARRVGLDIDVEGLHARFSETVRAGAAGMATTRAAAAAWSPDLGYAADVVAMADDPDHEAVVAWAKSAARSVRSAGRDVREIADAVIGD